MRSKLLLYMITVFFIFLPIFGFGQEIKLNADSLLKVASDYYKDKENSKTEAICTQILNSYPNYTDVKLLRARNNMAMNEFDNAKTILDEIIKKEPKNHEAHKALIDLNYWSKKYEACVICANTALGEYPGDQAFIDRRDNCIEESQTRMLSFSNDQIKDTKFKNEISAAYINDYAFDYIPTAHLAYLEYSRKFDRATLIGRVNYANRFNTDGYQFEMDSYIKTVGKSYLYLNAGISDNTVFPLYRFGAEYYQALPKKFEVSLGARYLDFDPTEVFIYTGSVSKYVNKYLFSLRGYLTPHDNDAALSGLFTTRRYSTDIDFIGIRLNYGIDPDFNTNIITPTGYYMKSTGVRLEYRKSFAEQWIATAYLGYENQEWLPKLYRDVITTHIVLSYLF